ncbi:MAG: hypothetical protein ASARMPRED_003167 [Alectoria sarmentosa]|nr:MAG: hypothetical protein ASARMPRED_003167 [Alectoria sarmentosa]
MAELGIALHIRTYTASNKDAVVHTQDSQCTEMSTPPAPSTDGVDAKIDVNGHREVPIAQTKDCPPPQTTKDHNEPGWIVEDTNSKNTVPQNTPKNNGMTAVTVNGDDHATFTLAPLPLTNGHHKDTSTPIDTNLFDDVWSPATKLKRRLEDTTDLIVCPGVYDGFSARIALAVGFDAMYMTGAGTTASRLGMADLGVASRTDMKEHADMIANLDPSKILIADMDTGYGGPITITTTVNQYIRANVAGFHIEDQLLTKRCGHLTGKKVVSREIYLSRIKAAKAAKDKARSDIVLIARTDANQQHGYEECLIRLRAARDIGADVGLLEGFKSKDEARRAVRDLAPWPLLLNVVENGHSPLFTVDEARDMGFRIIIFSFGALVPAYMAIKGAFERGSLGLEEAMEVDEIAGGEDFKGGV